MSKLGGGGGGGVAREARVSSWSGVPNRSTQAHIWQGVVGSTPCTQVEIFGISPRTVTVSVDLTYQACTSWTAKCNSSNLSMSKELGCLWYELIQRDKIRCLWLIVSTPHSDSRDPSYRPEPTKFATKLN